MSSTLTAITSPTSALSSLPANSPLLSLPREIRDMIWKYAIAEGEKKISFHNRGDYGLLRTLDLANRLNNVGRRRRTRRGLEGDGLNLLLTNVQVHSEAEPIFYGQRFIFSDSNALLAFIFVIQSKIHLIRSIELKYKVVSYGRNLYGSFQTNRIHDHEHRCLTLAVQALTGVRELNMHLDIFWFHLPSVQEMWNGVDDCLGYQEVIRPLTQISTLHTSSVKVTGSCGNFHELMTTTTEQAAQFFNNLTERATDMFQGTARHEEAQLEDIEREDAQPGDAQSEDNQTETVAGGNSSGAEWDEACLELLNIPFSKTKRGNLTISTKKRKDTWSAAAKRQSYRD